MQCGLRIHLNWMIWNPPMLRTWLHSSLTSWWKKDLTHSGQIVTHNSTAGEQLYLTVCALALRGPGQDSSVGEWIYLTVCPLCGPHHDSSMGEWMNLTVYPLPGRGSIQTMAEYFKGFFPARSNSANPSYSTVAENGSISTWWHHTFCGHWGGRSKSNQGHTDRQWVR